MIEVIEHLRVPAAELKKLKALLNPRGILFIKTKFLPEKESFEDWFYKRDLTHVQFFSPASLDWICRAYGFYEWKLLNSDLAMLINH